MERLNIERRRERTSDEARMVAHGMIGDRRDEDVGDPLPAEFCRSGGLIIWPVSEGELTGLGVRGLGHAAALACAVTGNAMTAGRC